MVIKVHVNIVIYIFVDSEFPSPMKTVRSAECMGVVIVLAGGHVRKFSHVTNWTARLLKCIINHKKNVERGREGKLGFVQRKTLNVAPSVFSRARGAASPDFALVSFFLRTELM